jgi:hypothetical protein
VGKKLFIGLVLLGLAGLVAGPFWFFFGDDIREYFGRVPFESAAWRDGERIDFEDSVRLRMVDDLLRRHHLVGMSKAEIDELLGPPTETGGFAGYDYAYLLGPERAFFRTDSEWLVIKFDQGRVVEARVVRS